MSHCFRDTLNATLLDKQCSHGLNDRSVKVHNLVLAMACSHLQCLNMLQVWFGSLTFVEQLVTGMLSRLHCHDTRSSSVWLT